MSEEPKPEQIINLNGVEGQTLFWHAKAWILDGRQNEVQSRMDEVWAHYRDIADDRLLSLVAALCVESYLDRLLQAISPGFDQYRDDVDFTFSVKIKVARGLRLMPTKILTVCDFTRQVRNEFAHHLERKRFDELDRDKYLNKLRPYVREFNSADREPLNYRQLFLDLVGFAIAALQVYTMQVSRLREFLETDASRNAFRDFCIAGRKESK